MGHKIFVSYKYHDNDVRYPNWLAQRYQSAFFQRYEEITVRDYVNRFEELIDKNTNHIFKGEDDGTDLSRLSDERIRQLLSTRIYDSSVTVVFISPNMRESYKRERDQWIPWEISYSLKETSRKNINGLPVTSRTNAIVAVILPDKSGGYYYAYKSENQLNENVCFNIVANNTNNMETSDFCFRFQRIQVRQFGYFIIVEWDKFIANYNKYINLATENQDCLDYFKICKEI